MKKSPNSGAYQMILWAVAKKSQTRVPTVTFVINNFD